MGGNREPERDIVGGFVARIIILWFAAGNIDSVGVALRQYCLHPKIDVFLAMHQDRCLSRYIAKTIYFFWTKRVYHFEFTKKLKCNCMSVARKLYL